MYFVIHLKIVMPKFYISILKVTPLRWKVFPIFKIHMPHEFKISCLAIVQLFLIQFSKIIINLLATRNKNKLPLIN